MPIETTRTVRVPAPVDAVWSVLADFGAIAEWGRGIDHSTMLSPPHDGGLRPGDARRVQVGRAALVETVAQVDPGRTLEYTIDGLPPMIPTVTNTWRLAPDGRDTEVSLTTRILDPRRPPQRLVLRAVAARFGRASTGLLDGLADRLRAMPDATTETTQNGATR